MDTTITLQNQLHVSKSALTSLISGLIGGPGIILPLLQTAQNPHSLLASGIFCFWWLFPVVSIALGSRALWQIHQHPDVLKGKTMAWLGIALGGLMILAWIGLMLVTGWLMLNGEMHIPT